MSSISLHFVNREEFLEVFQSLLLKIQEGDGTSIEYFYGPSGMGKTYLCRKMCEILDQNKKIKYSLVDGKSWGLQHPHHFLFTLRKNLSNSTNCKFFLFDTAYTLYCKKSNQLYLIEKEKSLFDKSLLITSKLVSALTPIPDFDEVLPKFLDFINLNKYLIKKSDNFLLDFKDLTMDYEMQKMLPKALALDLEEYQSHESKPLIIFVDHIETIDFHSLFNLIENTHEFITWILFGIDLLDWGLKLRQHIIKKGIPKEHTSSLLIDYIEEEDIVSHILDVSKGYPRYLDFAINKYHRIKLKARVPSIPEFPKSMSSLVEGFMVNVPYEIEKETIKLLSVPRRWNHEIFELIVKNYNIGFSTTLYNEILSNSFVERLSDGYFTMNEYVREIILNNMEKTDEKLLSSVNNILFNHYESKITETCDKWFVSPEKGDRLLIEEAFLHFSYIRPEHARLLFLKELKELGMEGHYVFFNNLGKILETCRHFTNIEKAQLLIVQGNLLFTLGELVDAMVKIEEAIKRTEDIFEEIQQTHKIEYSDLSIAIKARILLADIKFRMGLRSVANELMMQNYKIMKKLSVSSKHHPLIQLLIVPILRSLGDFQFERGNIEKALVFFKRSEAYIKKVDLSEIPKSILSLKEHQMRVGQVFLRLADIYNRTYRNYEGNKRKKMFNQAINYAKKAQKIFQNINYKNGQVRVSILLAGIYKSINKLGRARKYYKQGFEVLKTLDDKFGRCWTIINCADLLKIQNRIEEAIGLLEEGLDIARKLGDMNILSSAIECKADIFREKLLRMNEAVELYLEALEIVKQLGDQKQLDIINWKIAKSYEEIGELKKSQKYYAKISKLNDHGV